MGEQRNTTANYILSHLIVTIQHHLTYSCRVKKYGKLIYQSGTDLAPLLAESMYKNRGKTRPELTSEQQVVVEDMLEPFTHISQLLIAQAEKFLKQDPYEHDQMDIDNIVTQMDPDLWKAICQMTQSRTNLQGKSKANSPICPSQKTKKLRRVFLLCCMIFVVNDRCSVPMHILLADAIQSQGGSSLLIQMFNRLRACTSNETLK